MKMQMRMEQERPVIAEACSHYKVIRSYRDSYRRRVIRRGMTLEEARAHCADPETSSSTATSAAARRRTRERGPWFDGYDKEGA